MHQQGVVGLAKQRAAGVQPVAGADGTATRRQLRPVPPDLTQNPADGGQCRLRQTASASQRAAAALTSTSQAGTVGAAQAAAHTQTAHHPASGALRMHQRRRRASGQALSVAAPSGQAGSTPCASTSTVNSHVGDGSVSELSFHYSQSARAAGTFSAGAARQSGSA